LTTINNGPTGHGFDPEADAGFYAALRHTLDSRVALIELEANINDKASPTPSLNAFARFGPKGLLAGTGGKGEYSQPLLGIMSPADGTT
jgi:hypothetical protein